MRKSAFIVTTVERFDSLIKPLFKSIVQYNTLKGWDVYVVAQGYDVKAVERFKKFQYSGAIKEVYFTSKRLGPFNARDFAMRRWCADVWLALDDDMVMIDKTNYNAPTWLDHVQKPGVGIVMGQAATNETLLRRLIAKYDNPNCIEKAGAFMCTYGGMMYSDEVARCLLQIPPGHYSCDNTLWSLWLYKEGFLHYHYKGSWVIHKVGSPGGLRQYLGEPRELPLTEYVNWVRESKKKLADRHEECRWEWPTAKHLKPRIHEEHIANGRKRGFLYED